MYANVSGASRDIMGILHVHCLLEGAPEALRFSVWASFCGETALNPKP